MPIKTYSDEYLEHYGDMYVYCNDRYHLLKRGIRFEAFLVSPDEHIERARNSQAVLEQQIEEQHEQEISRLPGAGVRKGHFFQPLYHHSYKHSPFKTGRAKA